jgi:hypothetical protein
VKAGKESYRIVGAFDQFEYRQAALLFRRLAEEFGSCVYGLNRVKSELEVVREEQYQAWKNNLLQGCGGTTGGILGDKPTSRS